MQGSWRHVRPITWFILLVNLLFPLWVVHGMQTSSTLSCAKFFYNHCVAGGSDGVSTPLIPMLTMWLFADIFLLVGWVLSRPRPQLRGPSPYS